MVVGVLLQIVVTNRQMVIGDSWVTFVTEKKTSYLASSALVKSTIALALLTSKFVIMLWNFISSASDGTFSWTAIQIFLFEAWQNETLNVKSIDSFYLLLKNIYAWFSIRAFTCNCRNISPVEKIHNINHSNCLKGQWIRKLGRDFEETSNR